MPISPILFLIYISEIFEHVKKKVAGMVSLSFVDNLGFIASEISAEEVAKTLYKVSKLVLEWGAKNAVTYDTPKTKLVLFF